MNVNVNLKRVIELATKNDVPKRLILGKAAETFVKQTETARADKAAKFQELTLSNGFPEAN
ncbi:MAG: hypothetical protein V7L25_16485 [Nostoc sp.]|uniref:hypothetical protein n=1 Tax=Nostoc sp. TaxID=1180 RepID=UPI002FF42B05